MSLSRNSNSQIVAALFVLAAAVCNVSLGEAQDAPVDAKPTTAAADLKFETDVVPILRAYCWKCHGGDALEADLDLRTLPLLRRGGKSGPAIVDGAASHARLWQRVSSGEMPPGAALKPTAEHLDVLTQWLNAGAPADYVGSALTTEPPSDEARNWWAFQTPNATPIPTVRAALAATGPIDAFLLQRLDQQDLQFSPPTNRETWLRRVSLDLLGLAPDTNLLDEFLADVAPDAAERVIDRLLSSPHYGERAGRHWLDAAGYVDTIGSDNDATIIEERERIWMYRDYVIRSFNADKPFDRFLMEQIAGDELVDWKSAAKYDPATLELLIATGFLRQAADVTYAPELNTSDIRHQVLYDTVQILSTNVLGLTMHCAQCHDHKFDPISQAEYYQLLAFFAQAYDPQHWKHSKERHLFDISPAEQAAVDARNAELDRQIQQQTAAIAQTKAPFAQKLRAGKLAALPEPLRADTQTAIDTPADKRSEVQKYLAEKLAPLLIVSDSEIQQSLDESARQAVGRAQSEIQRLIAGKTTYGKLQALWNVAAPRTYLYRRGDFQTPGPEVRPGLPAVLSSRETVAAAEFAAAPRTQLAHWLTKPDHPLTGRVFVNRVWQNMFGKGLVATPDNFGVSGASPSHPELLDFLAIDFVRRGFSVKQLHRQIVSSAAYRQQSHTDVSTTGSHHRAESVDPENRLLWKMPLRRMDSEVVRDNLLAAAGTLDDTLYGPPIPLKPLSDGRVEIDVAKLPPGHSPFRRSVYLFCRRNYQLTELSVFDQPAVSHNCTRRNSTAVVLQSLTLLNGAFAFDQAEQMATAIRATAPENHAVWIERAYRQVFNRRPDTDEVAAARQFLQTQTARLQPGDQAGAAACAHLCQMLLNASEFLYIP